MKVSLDIQITEESLKSVGLTYEKILDETLNELADLYDMYDLKFDIGYNPQQITNGIRN